MCKKFIYLTAFVLLLTASGVAQADYQATFEDDFSTEHDYETYGVAGTGWDGMVGTDVNETVDKLTANIDSAGELYVQSTGARWEPAWVPLGPFLYKVVSGDFTATVHVPDYEEVLWNDCGIMARAFPDAAAGPGEDGETIEYFPPVATNYARTINDGSEDEWGELTGMYSGQYLRLKRIGNKFYHYGGPNPFALTLIPGSPITRDDMAGLPVQVGLWQCTYVSDVQGYVAFDDFELTYTVYEKAREPSPADEETSVLIGTELNWVAGDFVQASNGHEVYIGTNEAAVTDANNANIPAGVTQYIVSTPSVSPGPLETYTTYYWRVDEVDEPTRYPGDVWSFTTGGPIAANPVPADGSPSVSEDTTEVSWTPSPLAAMQDVYFGDTFGDANRDSLPDYNDIAGDANSVTIPGLPLVRGETIYWRVDTVNEPNMWKGDVWSFTVRPYATILFSDNFDTPHDYLEYGTIGTNWDGAIGRALVGETANAMDTNEVNHPGELYLESVDGYWWSPFDPLGPFLYKEVGGDFIATVYVADYIGLDTQTTVYNNNCGLMARASMDPDVAGIGEDWISIDYFPIWDVGIIARYCYNGTRGESWFVRTGWDADRYLQLERAGNTFYLRTSPDGSTWYDYPDANTIPMERSDFDGLPVQVGVHHCTGTTSTGFAAFDNFEVLYAYDVPHPYARSPVPRDGATNVAIDPMLMWKAGDYAQTSGGHKVYVGTDFNNVNDATEGSHPDVNLYTVNDPCVSLSLAYNITHYWRVDEVNGTDEWKGPVWSFTTEIARAIEPSPRDGQSIWADWLASWYGNKLYWTPSPYAVAQDFYFGPTFANVDANTTPDASLGGSDANASIPTGSLPLEAGEDYFWRVDTDNGSGMEKGDVWSFIAAEIVFYDDFNDPWDYVSKGPNEWEGVLYGEGVTNLIIEADRTPTDPCYPDELVLQSGGGYWADNPDNPYGPFLYKEVSGDFLATIKVADYSGLLDPNNAVYYNSIGLMARVGDVSSGGEGEDWVSIDFFPIYGVGIIARSCDDGGRAEDTGGDGTGWGADRYLQLERIGDTFRMYTSPDGIHWEEYPDESFSPVTRYDMNGPVQVGVAQATFTTTTGLGAFDDFILIRKPWPQARGPLPGDWATNVAINTKLNWTAGDFVQGTNGHKVYFGGDFNDVNDANATSHPDVNLYIVSSPTVDPGLLEFGTQYFWRVDEVNDNDSKVWKGNVWRFTTADYIEVDNFERYSTRDELRAIWKDGYVEMDTGSNITISTITDPRYYSGAPWYRSARETGPVYEGADAVQFVYDNDASVCYRVPGELEKCEWRLYYYSEMEANIADLECASDWTMKEVKSLSLWFYGDPCNSVIGDANQMYVAIEDGDEDVAIVKYGSDTTYENMNDLKKSVWQEWNIKLQRFIVANDKIDLDDVNKVYVGFGIRGDGTAGGYGIVYFDSIRLYPSKCVPEFTDGDFTGDCIIDAADFISMADGWRCKAEEGTDPNLVGQWKFDEASGTTANDSIGDNNGTVLGGAVLDGSGQLTFDGDDDYVSLPIGSVINTLDECSFAAWVDWPGTGGGWQRIFDIGQPNEVDPCDVNATTYSNTYMFMATSPFRYAITTGGDETEQIIDGTPSPMPSGLHCIVVTVDVNDADPNYTTLSLYLDGRLAGSNTDANLVPSDLGNTSNNWLGRSAYPADPYLRGSYDEFRIYNRVLSEVEVAQLYCSTLARERADLSGDGVVDFKDLAMMVDKWLQEVLWP